MAAPKQLLANLTLLGVTLGIGALLMEGAARMVLDAADYLAVDVQSDPILGGVPTQSSRSGLDAWGFRNRSLPKQADVVAIGDSHTYGNTARMRDAWPFVASKLTGLTIYNMGMGGYGPNQYSHLLETKALKLHPKAVVIGFYMGDDFENAFLITYGLKYWEKLRTIPDKDANFDIWEAPDESAIARKQRVWLSQNSVLYNVLFHGPLSDWLRQTVHAANATSLPHGATVLNLPEQNITEAFLPKAMAKHLDQHETSALEGMRITFLLLSEMNRKCREAGCQLMVALIPTKESVFAEQFKQHPDLPMSDVVASVLTNEAIAREKLFAFFEQEGILAIDTLPALRAQNTKHLYAPTASDMHPGANGYRVIGEVVAEALKQHLH